MEKSSVGYIWYNKIICKLPTNTIGHALNSFDPNVSLNTQNAFIVWLEKFLQRFEVERQHSKVDLGQNILSHLDHFGA